MRKRTPPQKGWDEPASVWRSHTRAPGPELLSSLLILPLEALRSGAASGAAYARSDR
jgi:hypothetical protein